MILRLSLLSLLTLVLSSILFAEDQTVKAASFGFEPEEATAALQGAIDSGAAKVIVENMGKPWIVDKIRLASNQEIIFEKGVVVQAKRGAFHGRSDALFLADSLTNVTLTGPGATLKMWKEDYDDESQYKHSEWRHLLSFRSCSKVRIQGLILADSGGDGIYLGVTKGRVPCSDFVIKDVTCENNYRQGISVISARDLLIENCVLKNTGGTAPMAGIDFEPNHPSDELSNCVMRNCRSENNMGSGYIFSMRGLNAETKPVSIRIENCRAVGSRESLRIITNGESDQAGVRGTLDFVNCVFEGGRSGGLSITDKSAEAVKVRFVDCRIVNPATEKPETSPIELFSRATSTVDLGGIEFKNLVIDDPVKREAISYYDMGGGLGVHEVSGNFVLNGIAHEVTADSLSKTTIKTFLPYPTEGLRYELTRAISSQEAKKKARARLRGPSEWLIWGEAGQEMVFNVRITPVGKGAGVSVPIRLLSPSGKATKLKDAAAKGETAYTVAAEETGAYRIQVELKRWTTTITSGSRPVCLFSETGRFHFLGTTGEFFFWVPEGTAEFGVRLSGDGTGERVKATLKDPKGEVVMEKDNIASAQELVAHTDDGAQTGVWSVVLSKSSQYPMEDFSLRLLGVPPILAPSPESLLRPVK